MRLFLPLFFCTHKPTCRIQKTERKKESIIAFPFAKTNILGEVRSGIICPHALLIWYIFSLPAKKMKKSSGTRFPKNMHWRKLMCAFPVCRPQESRRALMPYDAKKTEPHWFCFFLTKDPASRRRGF